MVVSYPLTAFSGYILNTVSEGRSLAELSLMVRLIFNPAIALTIGVLVGFFSKDNPALTTIVGLARWAFVLYGPAGRRALSGEVLTWIAPILVYTALGAVAAHWLGDAATNRYAGGQVCKFRT